MRNLNASSLKLVMFIAPVDRPCTGSASRQPIDAADDRQRDRFGEERRRRCATREKPSARSVPISRVR